MASLAEGRISAVHFGGMLTGGLALVSIYLWTSEGLSARNLELLDILGAFLRRLGTPYIVGGDWQMPPQKLEASGWVREVAGRVVAPSSNTFFHQGERR